MQKYSYAVVFINVMMMSDRICKPYVSSATEERDREDHEACKMADVDESKEKIQSVQSSRSQHVLNGN
jgi:hypothetical protein